MLEVEGAVLRKLGPPPERKVRRFRPEVSHRLAKVLEAADAEAARAGRHVVRAEDLLMGLAAEPDGKAARLLARLRERDHSLASS